MIYHTYPPINAADWISNTLVQFQTTPIELLFILSQRLLLFRSILSFTINGRVVNCFQSIDIYPDQDHDDGDGLAGAEVIFLKPYTSSTVYRTKTNEMVIITYMNRLSSGSLKRVFFSHSNTSCSVSRLPVVNRYI